MSRSMVGEKRARDEEVLKFIRGLTLSQHPLGQRKDLFLKKLKSIIIGKSLHSTEFQGYTIRERFERMGWEQLLNFSCDKIYKRVVIQWVASLSRNGDELTGMVDGKSYTITPQIVRDVLGVDSRKDLPYTRFNKADFEATSDENKGRWVEACKTVFGLEETRVCEKSKMTPLVQILWHIGVNTFHARLEEVSGNEIYHHEIYLLHALYTGDYLYSFAHLMIDDIWDMYEHAHLQSIPHGYYISEILNRLGAVSEDEYVEIIPSQHRLITRNSFRYLCFSESSTKHIIDDRVNLKRVTFPKKLVEQEAPPVSDITPDPQPDMTALLTNLENLSNMQSAESKKQQSEMMTVVTNIRKQIEGEASEAERRERQAEIRAHAIIWNMERQRYFYEQEQEQIHKAWKKAYGSEVFQFPQISHTSLHPPQAGSRYYDPTQGDQIPKAFQDLFHDIYGTKL